MATAENNNKKQRLMISAALLVTQLFIFVPLNLYFTNLDEMNMAFLAMFKLCLLPALMVFLILLVVGAIVLKTRSAGLKRSFFIVITSLSILVWLQSNVLLWDYGLLDGRLIDWNKDAWRGWIDLLVWITFLVGALLIGKTHEKWIENLGIGVFVLQFLTVGVLVVQHKESVNISATRSEASLENIYRFSTKQNTLHIMLDGFQSDVFNDLINIPQLGESYRKAFTGFTYYPETLGVFPYTRFSVPAFLSGKFYTIKMPQDEFVDEVLTGKNIINVAYEKGFDVDLVAGGPYLEKRYSHLKHNNLYNLDNMNSSLEEVSKIIDLALFRASPHALKRIIYNEQKWLLSPIFSGKDGMQFNYFKHTWFLNNLINNMVVSRDKPVYKYIHVMNTHNPMVVNGSCSYLGAPVRANREDLTIQAKCTLDTVSRLFERMKELGIYDNTLIIMHGDHGSEVPNHRVGKPIVMIDGEVAEPKYASLASPMLAIKLPQAKDELFVSDLQVSLADLPDTISDIMNWDEQFNHRSILTLKPGELRARHMHLYGWSKNEWLRKYPQAIQEFIITGSHYETKWQLGNTYFPPEN